MIFPVHVIEQNASLDNMCAVPDRHNCCTMEHKARKIHLNDMFVYARTNVPRCRKYEGRNMHS